MEPIPIAFLENPLKIGWELVNCPMTKRHHHIWNILEPSYWWPSSFFCWQLKKNGPISCFLCPKNAKSVIRKKPMSFPLKSLLGVWFFWALHMFAPANLRFLHENHITGDEIDMNHSPTTHQSLYLYLHAEFPHLWCNNQNSLHFLGLPHWICWLFTKLTSNPSKIPGSLAIATTHHNTIPFIGKNHHTG